MSCCELKVPGARLADDGEGGETDLTDEDIALLRKHTAVAVRKERDTGKEVDFVVVMTGVDP